VRVLPVRKIALGFVVVFGALRFNGFDLLLDPAGWVMCASGLWQLRISPGDSFDRVHSVAIFMVCVSTIAIFSGWGSSDDVATRLIGLLNTVGALIAVWVVAGVVIGRVRSCGESSRAALLDVLRWAVAGLGVLGLLAGYGFAVLGSVTVVVWFAALVAVVVVLYRSAELPCLSAEWRPVESGG
jgi:hypothetical protein